MFHGRHRLSGNSAVTRGVPSENSPTLSSIQSSGPLANRRCVGHRKRVVTEAVDFERTVTTRTATRPTQLKPCSCNCTVLTEISGWLGEASIDRNPKRRVSLKYTARADVKMPKSTFLLTQIASSTNQGPQSTSQER